MGDKSQTTVTPIPPQSVGGSVVEADYQDKRRSCRYEQNERVVWVHHNNFTEAQILEAIAKASKNGWEVTRHTLKEYLELTKRHKRSRKEEKVKPDDAGT